MATALESDQDLMVTTATGADWEAALQRTATINFTLGGVMAATDPTTTWVKAPTGGVGEEEAAAAVAAARAGADAEQPGSLAPGLYSHPR